jgi:hypothetical protein
MHLAIGVDVDVDPQLVAHVVWMSLAVFVSWVIRRRRRLSVTLATGADSRDRKI